MSLSKPKRGMRLGSPFPLFFLLAFLSLAIARPACAFSRIVSLKPNITEILYALGLGPQVVGATTYCRHPPEAEKLAKVADYVHVFTEKVLALKPDLIIASEENSAAKDIYFLMERGLLVRRFRFMTLEDTLASIQEIGDLTGRGKAARDLVGQMRRALSALESESASLPKKRVLFVVGYEPLIVAGGDNFFDEATRYIGAINVASQSRLKFPNYTTEALIAAAPDIVVDMAMGSEGAKNPSERIQWWSRYGSIPAVKNRRIYPFDIEKMRATPFLPSALRELRRLIHPELGEAG